MLRFGGVGMAATATHALAYLAALAVLAPQAANVVGFACAVLVSWLGHRYVTFRNARETPVSQAGPRFALTTLAGFALNAGWVALTTRVLDLPAPLAVGFIVLATPVLTYLAMRHWVFDAREAKTGAGT